MPSAAQLPESIAALARRQAFVLSDQRWGRDVDELAQQLQRLAPVLRPRRAAPSPVPQSASLPSSIASSRNSLAASLAASLARWLAGRLGKVFAAAMALAVIFILIRALGSAEVNHMLDKVIATVIVPVKALLG